MSSTESSGSTASAAPGAFRQWYRDSALVAFGTRRRTLGLSVLWQTTIPIALGLVFVSTVGGPWARFCCG